MENTTSQSESLLDDYRHYYNGPASPFSSEALTWFSLFVNILLAGSFSLLGVMANIVNIVVFYRQGPMSSSPTVILTSLAVSDLIVCILGSLAAGYALIDTFYFNPTTWSWYVQNFRAVTTARPLNLTTQITCWITTFMSFERAFSVTFPFKVKAVFTPRRSLAVVVGIFVFFLFIHAPNVFDFKLKWKTGLWLNSTYYLLGFAQKHAFPRSVHAFYAVASPVTLRFVSVGIVILCNLIIFWKVQSSQRFRRKTASAAVTVTDPGSTTHSNATDISKVSHVDNHVGTPEEASVDSSSKGKTTTDGRSAKDMKDMKLVRMITVVSLVFLACYSINVVSTIVLYLVFQLHVDYHFTVDNLVYDISNTFQIFNSFINTVIYFNMSSRYKEEFLALFRKNKVNAGIGRRSTD